MPDGWMGLTCRHSTKHIFTGTCFQQSLLLQRKTAAHTPQSLAESGKISTLAESCSIWKKSAPC